MKRCESGYGLYILYAQAYVPIFECVSQKVLGRRLYAQRLCLLSGAVAEGTSHTVLTRK